MTANGTTKHETKEGLHHGVKKGTSQAHYPPKSFKKLVKTNPGLKVN